MSLAALALAVVAAAAPALPALPAPPTRWVEDHAAMLSPVARDALDARLSGYERATGHQVVVWIGRTTGGADLADWAGHTFEAWRLGRKGIDDGIAIFVLADDRKIDIEVGYGLEDRVPDAIASRIIREVMAPRLQAGDRDGAVTAGANAVLAAIEGRPWSGAPAEAPAGTASHDDGLSPMSWVFGGVIGLILLVLFVTHPRLALMLLWSILSGGRGGFGGGGGNGGGFGGGGGGRSGGGGARGGW
jgi:uncharacterized protein